MIWIIFGCICVLVEIFVITKETIYGIKEIVNVIKRRWNLYKSNKKNVNSVHP
jgi:hypothetical protein